MRDSLLVDPRAQPPSEGLQTRETIPPFTCRLRIEFIEERKHFQHYSGTRTSSTTEGPASVPVFAMARYPRYLAKVRWGGAKPTSFRASTMKHFAAIETA